MAAAGSVGHKYLGKSGLKVSNICLGTMTFGVAKGAAAVFECNTQLDEEKSHQILDRYVELGGNFLDTANIYARGKSEEIIGSWLQKQNRDRIVVATKCRFQMDVSDVNKAGLSRRHIVQSVEESLARLKTNYIDILQAHAWDNAVPIEETLRTFNDLVRCGKIRYYGFSNVCGWQLQKIFDFAKYNGLNQPISLQQQYNLLCRQPEWEEFMVCKNEGIGVLPWSPLKGGLLTGKFKQGETPDKTQSRIGFVHTDEKRALQSAPAWSNYAENKAYWNLVDVMSKIATTHGKSIPQVAIRWLLQQDVVVSVIIGATSLKQLDDNMGASGGWELSKEEMAELDAASPRMSYYPYEMIWRVNGPDRFNEFNRSIKI
ncbi:hypothetical protein CHS0354_009783 [Potamilus streckersoni]|uniref:NADP-dependent oxidoreductase domain-containing protein n=1 Tax=Potamilus streckersoni TaxID=2493646 RepID=A0AAE0W1G9_9BIVA|nr:hypothetical protein CHS0354_009783 [Potamilus streckersoni]